MIENGWTCVNTGNLAVCTPVCGDGKKLGTEACDDGTNNGIGCLTGCSGPVPGFTCMGGNVFSPDFCFETCGDGIITSSE